MLILPTHVRVFAATAPTNMRKSFAGLVGLVEKELGQQVEAGGLFLFFSRRRNAVKVLFFTGDGLAIFYPRQFHVRRRARVSDDESSSFPSFFRSCGTNTSLTMPRVPAAAAAQCGP